MYNTTGCGTIDLWTAYMKKTIKKYQRWTPGHAHLRHRVNTNHCECEGSIIFGISIPSYGLGCQPPL